MAISKEILDELLKDYKGPEDITGENGLLKELTKALIERAMQAELSEELGYEKSQKGEKPTTNRRNGSSGKTLRSDCSAPHFSSHRRLFLSPVFLRALVA